MNDAPILIIGKNGNTGSRANERLKALGVPHPCRLPIDHAGVRLRPAGDLASRHGRHRRRPSRTGS